MDIPDSSNAKSPSRTCRAYSWGITNLLTSHLTVPAAYSLRRHVRDIHGRLVVTPSRHRRGRARFGRRIVRTLLAVLLALGLTGSVPAPALGLERGRSLLEMRQDRVVGQKWGLSCGAAALATLLTYEHHDTVSEREVALGLIGRPEYLAKPELVRTNQGFSLLDLKRFVQGRGYKGVGYGRLGLADLAELAPAIVPLRLNGYDHFVVYRGRRGDRVLLADPAWGNRTMPLARFEAAWLASPEFGRVAFVVARADGAPPADRLEPRPNEFVR